MSSSPPDPTDLASAQASTDADAPRVTLYLMAYRQADVIEPAVRAAFAQTWPNLEILLSDDASDDGTWEILQRLAAGYDGPHRVRLNRNPDNLGILGHVNRLMELASGGLIVSAAGDDLSEPERVERLARAWIAGEGRVHAVHSDLWETDEAGVPRRRRRPLPCLVADPGGPAPRVIAQEEANPTGAAMAWSAEVFARFGPLPDVRGAVEDGQIFFRAALLGEIAYVPEPLVRYRMTGASAASSDESPAHRHLYGHRITRKRWWLANHRAFARDLARPDLPRLDAAEAAALARLCRRRAEACAFELGLSAMSRAQRLAALPQAAALSLRRGSPRFVVETLKFLFEESYARWLDLRLGRRGGARAGVEG